MVRKDVGQGSRCKSSIYEAYRRLIGSSSHDIFLDNDLRSCGLDVCFPSTAPGCR